MRLGGDRTWRWTIALAVALALLGAVGASASHLGDGKKHKIEGVGGWKNVEALELVVFGPALQNFVTKGMDDVIKQSLAEPQGDTYPRP